MGHDGEDSFEEHGHALLALAAALVHRACPVPDEAATTVGRVVDVLDQQPTSSVTAKLWEVATGLHPYTSVTVVRDLRERLSARLRLAMPPGAA